MPWTRMVTGMTDRTTRVRDHDWMNARISAVMKDATFCMIRPALRETAVRTSSVSLQGNNNN